MAQIIALVPLGDGQFDQSPIALLPDPESEDDVVTVPLAEVADWLVVNDPALGTVVAVTVTCAGVPASTGGADAALIPGKATFVIEAGDEEIGELPPPGAPSVVPTPDPTPAPSPGAAAPGKAGPAPGAPGALANTGAGDAPPAALIGGLLPLAPGTLGLALVRRHRRARQA